MTSLVVVDGFVGVSQPKMKVDRRFEGNGPSMPQTAASFVSETVANVDPKVLRNAGEEGVKGAYLYLLKELADMLAGENFAIVTQLRLFIYMVLSCYDSKSSIGIVSAILSFCESSMIPSYTARKIVERIESFKHKEYQSWADSDIGKELWGVLTSLSVVSALSGLGYSPWAVLNFRRIGDSFVAGKDGVDGFFSRFLAFLKKFFEKLYDCFKTGTLDPLFEMALDPVEWMFTSYSVLNDDAMRLDHCRQPISVEEFRRRQFKGELPARYSSPLTPGLYLNALKQLCDEGTVLVIRLGKMDDGSLIGSIKKRMVELQDRITKIENHKLTGASRVTPFAVYFWGKSHVGKSTFLGELWRILHRAHGLPDSEELVYYTQRGSNFWDGVRPDQVTIIMDDQDKHVGAISASVTYHPQMVVNLVNTRPTQLEQAAVEDKGRTFATLLFLLYASNFSNGRLEGLEPHPEVFWNRFPLWVEVQPADKFSVKGQLNKTLAGQLPHEDCWKFRVGRYSVEKATGHNLYSCPPYDIIRASDGSEWMSKTEFIALVVVESKNHMVRETQRLKDTMDTSFCTICFRSVATHPEKPCTEHQSFILLSSMVAGAWATWKASSAGMAASDAANQFSARCKAVVELAKRYEKKIVVTLATAGTIAGIAGIAYGVTLLYRQHQAFVVKDRPKEAIDWAMEKKTVDFLDSSLATTSVPDMCVYLEKRIAKALNANGAVLVRLVHVRGLMWMTNSHALSAVPLTADEVGDVIADKKQLVTTSLNVVFGNQHCKIDLAQGRDFWKVPLKDIVIVRIPKIVPPSGSLISHMFSDDMISSFSVPDSAVFVDGRVNLTHCRRTSNELLYQGVETQLGSCGTPVVIKVKNSVGVIGIHYVTYGMDKAAQVCTVQDLEKVLAKCRTYEAQPFVYDSSQFIKGFKEDDVELFPLSQKSSIGHAIMANPQSVAIIGELSKHLLELAPKTRCRMTSSANHPRVKAFCLKYTGEEKPFHIPIFKGSMESGKWTDPYIRNWCGIVQDVVESRYWDWIVDDYVGGLKMKVVKPLTLSEAFFGYDELNPFDLNTSAGIPFFVKKKLLVSDGELSDVVVQQVDKIVNTASSCVYVPACVHTLKDEPLSTKKFNLGKVRVFNTMSLPFNIAIKMYIGPIFAQLLNQREDAEIAIGLNMNSSQIDEWFNRLMRFPDRCGDGDFEFQDLRMIPDARLAEVEVWRRLAQMAGYDEEQVRVTCSLVVSTIYTMRFIKNDVIAFAGSNPSGAWTTSITASIHTCLTFRYCYLRHCIEAREALRPFRDVVVLMVLGDDNVYGISNLTTFGPVALKEYMRSLGHNYTDSAKRDVAVWKSVWEVSFLKRKLVKRDGIVWCPIEIKTLCKMMIICGPSTLSDSDHEAILWSNVKREAVLHGELFFNEVEELIESLGETSWKESGYFEHYTFGYYREQLLERNYRSWTSNQLNG